LQLGPPWHGCLGGNSTSHIRGDHRRSLKCQRLEAALNMDYGRLLAKIVITLRDVLGPLKQQHDVRHGATPCPSTSIYDEARKSTRMAILRLCTSCILHQLNSIPGFVSLFEFKNETMSLTQYRVLYCCGGNVHATKILWPRNHMIGTSSSEV